MYNTKTNKIRLPGASNILEFWVIVIRSPRELTAYLPFIEWYNLVFVACLICTIGFVITLIFGLVFNPSANVVASPQSLDQHWEDLKAHNKANDLNEEADISFKKSMLPMYVSAAEINHKDNKYLAELKKLAGFMIASMLFFYLIMFMLILIKSNA